MLLRDCVPCRPRTLSYFNELMIVRLTIPITAQKYPMHNHKFLFYAAIDEVLFDSLPFTLFISSETDQRQYEDFLSIYKKPYAIKDSILLAHFSYPHICVHTYHPSAPCNKRCNSHIELQLGDPNNRRRVS